MLDLIAQTTPAALRDIAIAVYVLVGVTLGIFLWENFISKWFRRWF